MRGRTVKRIDDLVKNHEVLTVKEMSSETKPNIHRRKKKYWNSLSCTEKSLRSLLVKEGK